MKTQYRTLILVPALLVLFLTLNPESSSVFAQGTAFTYQGQFDNGGVPANGLYDMAFRLYAVSSGGSPVAGPVTNTAVGVTNGLFITAVNFGNVFSSGSNWLEVAVSSNGANAFTTLAPRQQLTPVPYAIASENLSGTVAGAGLAGIYGNQVSFSNTANQFSGSFAGAGGNLTGLNASQLIAGTVPFAALSNAWKTTGNSGTSPGTNFVGTLDNQPLEFRVNNQRGLRLEPAGSNSVNVIGGWIGNGVAPGTVGATVSGGGAGSYYGLIWSNQVASDFGTVAGGTVNSIQWGARYANIGGGWNNMIQSNAYSSAIGGGENNTIQTAAYESTIAGGFLNTIEGGQVNTIGGGDYNTVEPGIYDAVIGGGHDNLIQSNSWFATIAGGSGNDIQTNNNYSTISGGGGNQIQTGASTATIGGGIGNMILTNDTFASIGGGLENVVSNDTVETTIAGGRQNTIGVDAPDAVIGGGLINTIQVYGGGSVIAGGYGNLVQPGADVVNGQFASISGGLSNSVSGYGITIGGGDYNTIEPGILDSVIGGGHVNLIQSNSWFATVGGGSGNNIQTNDNYSTISGGGGNLIQTGAGVATIAGGDGNMILANDSFAVIGGGLENVVQNSAVECTIAGGRQNTIGTNAPDAVIGGGLINSIQLYGGGSVIAGGYGNLIQPGADAVNGEFASISGGLSNSVSGYGITIGGGVQNSASAFYATVGGGNANSAGGEYASIGGGSGNTATGEYASISGGGANIASTFGDTVGGGYGNTASSPDGSATVSGGYQNTASGDSSTVPGGYNNTASGAYSFAAGYGAQASNDDSFVWSDGYGAGAGLFSSTANDQFCVRAAGGLLFAGDVQMAGGAEAYHNFSLSGGNALGYLYGSFPALADGIHLGYNFYYDAGGNGHVFNAGGATSRLSMQYGQIILAVGQVDGPPSTNRLVANMTGVTVYGTFNNSSDRNAKQDFAPINSAQILEKVGKLPISEWSYKEDPRTRHVGPMGQDFYATFNIGTDEKHIAPIDEGGVALAAIQGLNQKLEEKDTEIEALKERVDKLERLVEQTSGGK
ncbi:MAG TPA: tail fiber domain-containing protein [Alphaproteobacteria bacterium]|nr:tail fiber domain-containing protein [Alphaproteobacteria bacterium]